NPLARTRTESARWPGVYDVGATIRPAALAPTPATATSDIDDRPPTAGLRPTGPPDAASTGAIVNTSAIAATSAALQNPQPRFSPDPAWPVPSRMPVSPWSCVRGQGRRVSAVGQVTRIGHDRGAADGALRLI